MKTTQDQPHLMDINQLANTLGLRPQTIRNQLNPHRQKRVRRIRYHGRLHPEPGCQNRCHHRDPGRKRFSLPGCHGPNSFLDKLPSAVQ